MKIRKAKRSKTTGRKPRSKGRPFQKGNPGKPKGAKDKFPGRRVLKGSVAAIYRDIAEHEGETVYKAIIGGIKAGPRHAYRYIDSMAAYVDGKPQDNLSISRFDDDELSTAEQRTDAQIARLMKTILAKRTTNEAG